jgi:hypothetical protein
VDIELRDHTGATIDTQKIKDGYYIFTNLPTSGNPYTVIGTAKVFGTTYGKTEGGIIVTPGSTIRVNLIMTYPPS